MKTAGARGRGFGLSVRCRDSSTNMCISCVPRARCGKAGLVGIVGLSHLSTGGQPGPGKRFSCIRNCAVGGKHVFFPMMRPFNGRLHGFFGGPRLSSGCYFSTLCSSAGAVTGRVTRGGGFILSKRCGKGGKTRVDLKTVGMPRNSIAMATNNMALARGASCAISCSVNIIAVVGRDVLSTKAGIGISFRDGSGCNVRHGALVKFGLRCSIDGSFAFNKAFVFLGRRPLAAGIGVNRRPLGGAL